MSYVDRKTFFRAHLLSCKVCREDWERLQKVDPVSAQHEHKELERLVYANHER